MGLRKRRKWKQILWPGTLKSRLSLLLVIVTITPITLLGFTSYYWMYKMQTEKISANYQSIVNNEQQTLEKVFSNLSSVSQLLVVNGGLGDDVIDYLTTPDPVHKTNLFLSIDKSLLNIIYSNPTIKALFFYLPTFQSSIQFETAPLKSELSLQWFDNPPFNLLYRANELRFHAPHQSVLLGQDELVVSLTRSIEFAADNHYYIYLEAKFADLIHSQSNNLSEPSPIKLLLGADGSVMYSDIPTITPIGSAFSENSEAMRHYKSFSSKNVAGWSLYSLVPLGDYQKEMKQWQQQFLLVATLSLLVTIVTASYIWRMVYRPLQRINLEIMRFSDDQTERVTPRTHLKEFDMLFSSFREMRVKVIDLIIQVEQKEKLRGELEVEKLMLQINPHFLHNSLNTIQWLARENGQTEIFNLVKVFTRVLQYNLGKSKMMVTMQAEMGALYDYIELQNIRYDHRFDVKVEMAPELADVPIPRFVLQPLVENALYHGLLSEQGNIRITISRIDANLVSITVIDNGKGIPPEKIEQLLRGDGSRETGLGIGLNYVKKMLDVYYEHEAELHIESIINKGTTIRIIMPDRRRENPDD
ncbi:MAG: sensor histidine kinase [Gorillibacterium sp.]|nr:sensor histidine kinase [Gorillibacterium sp.]